ncbi:hypothetical protein CEXT_731241 [Caerostris extrusa]|uniref:Uncharacterized protein n=1 Tax=Caerostris extrusa TaxID=172846 RepID=A0AAV4VXU0_CAEEX|nr:hypothetical protein CEXT_731241 [Caerostris extrusa]
MIARDSGSPLSTPVHTLHRPVTLLLGQATDTAAATVVTSAFLHWPGVYITGWEDEGGGQVVQVNGRSRPYRGHLLLQTHRVAL